MPSNIDTDDLSPEELEAMMAKKAEREKVERIHEELFPGSPPGDRVRLVFYDDPDALLDPLRELVQDEDDLAAALGLVLSFAERCVKAEMAAGMETVKNAFLKTHFEGLKADVAEHVKDIAEAENNPDRSVTAEMDESADGHAGGANGHSSEEEDTEVEDDGLAALFAHLEEEEEDAPDPMIH